jgi:hypothetical protein
MNHVFMINMNTAAPVRAWPRLVVDPERRVRFQAGRSASTPVDALGLVEVARFGTHGTAGLGRVCRQFLTGEPGLPFPMHQGQIDPPRRRPVVPIVDRAEHMNAANEAEARPIALAESPSLPQSHF